MSKEKKVIVRVDSIAKSCVFGYEEGEKAGVFVQNPDKAGGMPIVEKGDICPDAFAPIHRQAFCMLLGGKIPWSEDEEGKIVKVGCPDAENRVVFELELKEE